MYHFEIQKDGQWAEPKVKGANRYEDLNEMLESIQKHGGADANHTINTLSHVGDVMRIEYEDAEGHDRFYRYMASIQEFFDQA